MHLILIYSVRLALRFGFCRFDLLQALAGGPDALCDHFDNSASSFSVIQCLTGKSFSGLEILVCHD